MCVIVFSVWVYVCVWKRGIASGCECDLALTFWHFPTHHVWGNADKSIISSFLLEYSCLGLSPVCFAVLVSLFIWWNQVSDSYTVTLLQGKNPPCWGYKAIFPKNYWTSQQGVFGMITGEHQSDPWNETSPLSYCWAVTSLCSWPYKKSYKNMRLLFIPFVWHSSPIIFIELNFVFKIIFCASILVVHDSSQYPWICHNSTV